MAVLGLIDDLATHLGTAVTPALTLVGAAEPTAAGDLPAVSLAVADVVRSLPGLGRIPGPTRTGALAVSIEIDLADPVVRFPDEDVPLVSTDRRQLQLPHGTIVKADGTAEGAFTATDLGVRVGATDLTVVAAAPGAGQVRPDPITGLLTLGDPLPATGTVRARYFVGQWEERTDRFTGQLLADAWAATPADVVALSRSLETALFAPLVAGLLRIEPVAVGTVEPAEATRPGVRRRRLTYRIEAERVEPIIATGGGPIRVIRVGVLLSSAPPETETFEIT